MSSGLVICSKCKRETEQSGPKSIAKGWRHRDDGTTLCDGAESRYPTAEDGARCEARVGTVRCSRAGVKWLPTRNPWETIWVCEGSHGPPARTDLRDPITGERRGGAGNARNAPCHCGSGRKAKKCCAFVILLATDDPRED